MNENKKENSFVFNANDIRQQVTLSAEPEVQPQDFADAFPGRDVLRKISVKLEFTSAGEEILAHGAVSAVLSLECSRCGEPAVGEYNDSFDECFPNSVEYIDVRENIRETLSLMEPMKVLCSVNCKGRCPQCGADLNKVKCSCEPLKASPFAALKQLRPEK